MTTFNCNDFLFLPVSMKNESGGKWVEYPQTIGWFFFWPFFYFLNLKFYSFLIFYFPSFIFLFNWLLSKIESASNTHTMGWLLAFGPLGSTGQRKIGSHPARHKTSQKKGKWFFMNFANQFKHPVSVVLLFSFSLLCGLCSQIVETFVWEKTAM